MLCKIADLTVEIPDVGGLAPRCGEYICENETQAQIILEKEKMDIASWQERGVSIENAYYLESGFMFYRKLLKFNGFYLHASAVEMNGRAYLFSAPCGTGKSTHTKLWQEAFGENAQVFNDDKPAMRVLDGKCYAYGTPWCGKDGINQNKKVSLGGICFIKRGEENKIRRLNNSEALQRILWQTLHKIPNEEPLDRLLGLVDDLIRHVPVYELECLPNVEAAKLSYETMRRGAEEADL